MAVPFDHIASTYDSVFTRSAIGQLQRKRVWKYVETIIPELKGFEMLELNCGTGEDADLFGEKGYNMIATDISEEMLKITNRKGSQFSMHNRISSHYLDLDSLNETLFDKKFDLVFSNFGGINCINPESLKKLLQNLPSILNPGGRFVGVVMPKFCAWETIFFMLRLQFKKAFRRYTSNEVISDLHGKDLKTWYYRPAEIKRWSRESFRLINIKPVGLALPSAYLERFIRFRKHWLLRLNNLEKKVSHSTLFSGMADNYIIDLQLMS
jgi:ubiquinone/menaquinone biosynthesis C-methylase UbiE